MCRSPLEKGDGNPISFGVHGKLALVLRLALSRCRLRGFEPDIQTPVASSGWAVGYQSEVRGSNPSPGQVNFSLLLCVLPALNG
ncbi:hypothetical protein PoB_003131700 [Plakobranchus ocellatus]|uniref:Uncharacterized protein n=1 Tax=Plakobranchus ocellatus TaxID=259542 RepID=A0AAV4AD06_9GAST|nr:hypothetical protein PoB_003131700 [Plakobranchus ocellatus]